MLNKLTDVNATNVVKETMVMQRPAESGIVSDKYGRHQKVHQISKKKSVFKVVTYERL